MSLSLSNRDAINAIFEGGGAILTWMNVARIRRDRVVRGVLWQVQGFWTAWGFWNLYYYGSLGQPLSLAAGSVLVAGNAAWVGHAIWYGLGMVKA